MAELTLERVTAALRDAWGRDTCDPVDVAEWHPGNPARGQCGVTALVLHDHFGGELLVAEVRHADGRRQGVHWSNRLPDGTDLDLTREQFTDGEVIDEPRTVVRPEGPPKRCREQYELLRSRVLRTLDMVGRTGIK